MAAVPGQDAWRDFFLGVASAGAALTGLVFVAISLHPKQIAADPVLRTRARGALAGFTAALVVGLALLLPDQIQRPSQAALGLFAVVALASVVRLQLGQVHHALGSPPFYRWLSMSIAYTMVAAAGLGFSVSDSNTANWLYVLLAAACFLFLATAVWQCWLLVLQIEEPDGGQDRANSRPSNPPLDRQSST